MSRYSARGSGKLVAFILTAAAVAGCNYDRASVFEPLGRPSYDFRLAPDGRNLPQGTLRTEVPNAAVNAATVDSIYEITLRGLEPLVSGVYQVWLGTVSLDTAADPDTLAATAFVKATGTLVVTRTDTSFNAQGDPVPTPVTVRTETGVSSFVDGGPATSIRLTVNRASLGAGPFTFNLALVSLEADAAAAQPSDRRPLWSRTSEGVAGTRSVAGVVVARTRTGPFRFGNFHPDAAKEYRFVATGRGTAGIRGNVLVVDDSALARPPRGYYYAAFLVKDTVGGAADTAALGPQTAPFPNRNISLIDADINRVSPVVLDAPFEIFAAANRLELPGSAPFFRFRNLWITLENKLGDDNVAAPTIILSGAVPSVVADSAGT